MTSLRPENGWLIEISRGGRLTGRISSASRSETAAVIRGLARAFPQLHLAITRPGAPTIEILPSREPAWGCSRSVTTQGPCHVLLAGTADGGKSRLQVRTAGTPAMDRGGD